MGSRDELRAFCNNKFNINAKDDWLALREVMADASSRSTTLKTVLDALRKHSEIPELANKLDKLPKDFGKMKAIVEWINKTVETWPEGEPEKDLAVTQPFIDGSSSV